MLRLWITPLRDPICGLLLPSIFPSKGDKEADESSLTAPVKAMILSSKASRMPKSHLTILRRDLSTSLPMQELQSLRFPQDRFSPSALRCQMPSLTHNRDSLIALRMEGYAILCCILSNKFEKVSNSPAHRGELKTNPNILNLFWNRIPNISHVPTSLKETVAVEQSLTSASSPTTSHLIGGGLDSFPSREEASAHRLPSYLPVAEVLFKGLWQCGFVPQLQMLPSSP